MQTGCVITASLDKGRAICGRGARRSPFLVTIAHPPQGPAEGGGLALGAPIVLLASDETHAASQVQRLDAHTADVADALGLTAERVRHEMTARA